MEQTVLKLGALTRWLKKLKGLQCYKGCARSYRCTNVTFVTLVTFSRTTHERDRREASQRTATTGSLGDFDAGALQLGTQELNLAAAIWARLLRDRDDRNCRIALRYCAVWRRSFPAIAASGRSYDCRRHGDKKNGAADRPPLQPDARSKICYFDGRVRNLRRAVQARLQRAQRDRPLHSGRCLYSRLPPAARSVAARFHGTAAEDRQSKTDGREQGRASRSGGTERIPGAIIWRARFGAAGKSGCVPSSED